MAVDVGSDRESKDAQGTWGWDWQITRDFEYKRQCSAGGGPFQKAYRVFAEAPKCRGTHKQEGSR